MYKYNAAEIKNSYAIDKDKLNENNENSIKSINSSKVIGKRFSLQDLKLYGLNKNNDKEENLFIKSLNSNKRKSVFVKSNYKRDSVNVSNGKNIFTNLLNECLLNITQQANRKNIVNENNDNITKADKKFLKEYKLNYLNNKAKCLRSCSLDINFKQNKLLDNKNINKIRKSSFHKKISSEKIKIKHVSPMHIYSKFFLKKKQSPKIPKTNHDDINNIKQIENIIRTNSIKNNSNIKASEMYSTNSPSLNSESIFNLSKKIENKKPSNKKKEDYKTNQNNCNSGKSICRLDKEKSKTKPTKFNKKLKFKIKKNLSLPDEINFESLQKISVPKYLKNSTIINKENITNLPFLNNNLSNEDLVISSNLKQMIKKHISDFKSSSLESSFECEGVKNLTKEIRNNNVEENKIINITSNKDDSSVDNSEIKSKKTIESNSKIANKNKNNRKINEKLNSSKADANNSQNNFLLENCNDLKSLNEKVLADNISVHTNYSYNSVMNDNNNSQIVFLNKSNQRSKIFPPENNGPKNEKTNNNVFLGKVNTSMNNKSLMKLEIFRNLERKNIIYDSLDDEEIDEFDENSLCLNPHSIYVIIIDIYIAFSTIFYMIMIPLHLAKNKQFCINSIYSFKSCFIYLNDLIFLIDLITGFFKKFYNFEEQLINNHSIIIKHYLKRNFVLDLISAVPLLTIKIFTTPKCTVNNITLFEHTYYDCKLNNISDLWKLIKIIKIAKILNDNVFIKYLNKCIDKFNLNGEIITFITYMIVAIPSLHFATCLNIFISRNSYPNWLYSLNMQYESFSKIYLISLYHIITSVTTVGYGDITPTSFTEAIFQLIILLIGIVAYSWLVSSVSNYIKTSNEKYIEYENKLRILDEIKLKNPNMPNNLYKKIVRHLNYGKKKEKKDNDLIFEILPYSLKNSLIYEMYKPIINNFTIFKNSQNSDFVISTIMAFKPFSAGKNDLIVKFGDILEEMIFVKKGKLSIEICINKKYQLQIIESYLNDPLLHDDKIFQMFQKKHRDSTMVSKNLSSSILNCGNSNIMKYTSIFPFKMESSSTNIASNLELDGLHLEEDKVIRTKTNDIQNEINLKILDIRQNEYFGDILMFLGYKSPFNIKVKSKEAELFLLRKVDAINISLTYKNIWNRINEISTFNIEEIKLQIQKVVKQYCQTLGIKVNKNKNTISSIKMKNNKIESYKNVSPNSLLSTLIGESNIDNSINFTKYFNSAVSNSKIIKTSQKSIYSIINKIDDKNDKDNNIKKNNFLNNKNEEIEKLKISSSLDFESFSLKEKENSNIIGQCKNSSSFKLSNKFYGNGDVKSNEYKNETKFITQAITLGKNDSNNSNNAKLLPQNRQPPNHNIAENNSTYFRLEEINDEIYPGEEFEAEINKNCGDTKDFLSYNNKKNHSFHSDDDSNKNIVQNNIIKENVFNEKKNDIIEVKYSNNILKEIKNFSLEYKSTYDNLNQFTKYQYSKDIELQLKTRLFLEDICFNKSIMKVEDRSNSISLKYISKMNNDTNEIKNNKEFLNDDSPPINKNFLSIKFSGNLNKSSTNNICTIRSSDNDNNSSNSPKNINNYSRCSKKGKNATSFSSKKLDKVNNCDSSLTLKKGKTFRKICQKSSLFAKSSFQKNNYLNMSNCKKPKKTNKSNKLLNMVNKNIIQDSQNINNPEMFYSDLFSSLMKKQKRSEIAENKEIEHRYDPNITSENQDGELSFKNNKENTLPRYLYSIKAKNGELSPNSRKNRNNKL